VFISLAVKIKVNNMSSNPASIVTAGSTVMKGMKRQPLGTVALIQVGLFLSATLASIIGGAWTNVVSGDFDSSLTLAHMVATANAETGSARYKALRQSYTDNIRDVKDRNMKYAIFVTVIGLLIMVAWTLFVQQLDPDLVSYVEAG